MNSDTPSMPSEPTVAFGYRPTPQDEPSFGSAPTMVPGGASSPSEPQCLGRIDQYELIRKLGGGGFGVVYLARDTVSGVDVALKTLHPLMKSNAEEMERLREKFALVSRLSHTNIASALVLHPVREVMINDAVVWHELRLSPGDSVMVMRYAPGITLSKWRRQFKDGIVPMGAALEVGRQIAAALDYAHGERIVHRDIKPANVMVETLPSDASPPSRVEKFNVEKLKGNGSDAANQQSTLQQSSSNSSTFQLFNFSTFQQADAHLRVRLLDFGLAAEIRSSMSRVSSETGDTSGTRPYMAPEQWLGRKQDARTDQYALACVLYELLSGEPPFAGVFETGDPAIMMQAVKGESPDEIDGVPPAVNAALLKALSKNPKERFSSCSEFVAALVGGTRTGVHHHLPALHGVLPRLMAHPGALAAVLAAIVLAVFGAGSCGYRREVRRIRAEAAARVEEARVAAESEKAAAAGRASADRKAREEVEQKMSAERKALKEAERRAQEEADRRAAAERRVEEERKAREEAERKAREEAESKAAAERRVEAERKAREEAERKVREEAERRAREEAERKAREEAERKAREAAERKAREEAERRAREEAERRAREEAERRAKAEADAARRAREEAERKARAEQEAAARRAAEESARLSTSRTTSIFFPVYGITLGKTTLNEIRGLGGTSSGEFASKCVDYRELSWWDHDKDGVCESVHMLYHDPMPPEWVRLGMDMGMSYDDWTAFFRRKGYSISTSHKIFEKAPTVERYQGRKTLSATFTALSPDGRLSFKLNFDYGNEKGEGYSTSSRNSLYSITVDIE